MGKLSVVLGRFLAVMLPAAAQTGGQINGEVRDPSGALIPSASVTVTNVATNAWRATTTNSAGKCGNIQLSRSDAGRL